MGALVKRVESLGDEQIIPKNLAKLNKFESKVRAAKSTAVLGGPTFDGQIDESSLRSDNTVHRFGE